jgi:hypothetical protein
MRQDSTPLAIAESRKIKHDAGGWQPMHMLMATIAAARALAVQMLPTPKCKNRQHYTHAIHDGILLTYVDKHACIRMHDPSHCQMHASSRANRIAVAIASDWAACEAVLLSTGDTVLGMATTDGF